MSDTLYLQLDQNIEVTNPHVYLQDIAGNGSRRDKARTLCHVCVRSSEKDPEAGTIY